MAHRFDVRQLLVATAALLLAACSSASPPVRGVVLEAGSNRPLADATVYIQWMAYGSAAGLHSRTACTRIDFARTDGQGRFELPGGGGAGLINVYKPGYVQFKPVDQYGNPVDDRPLAEPKKLFMQPFTGTVKERLEYLMQQSRGKECGPREGYAKKLEPFYGALYLEAKGIAAANRHSLTSQDKEMIRSLHGAVEELEFGYDESRRRLRERWQRDEY